MDQSNDNQFQTEEMYGLYREIQQLISSRSEAEEKTAKLEADIVRRENDLGAMLGKRDYGIEIGDKVVITRSNALTGSGGSYSGSVVALRASTVIGGVLIILERKLSSGDVSIEYCRVGRKSDDATYTITKTR